MSRRRQTAPVLAAVVGLACGPSSPPLTDCSPTAELEPHCDFQNPEDLALHGDWLVVSQLARGDDAGSLVALRLKDGPKRALFPGDRGRDRTSETTRADALGSSDCPGPPDPTIFAPQGLDLDGPVLLVVNHGGREAVEIFGVEDVSGEPSLTWRGCVPLPSYAMGNDVAALPDAGGFLVSNFMPRAALSRAFRLLAGMDTGNVLRWTSTEGWSAVPGSDGRVPNGVAVTREGQIYFAEWGREQLVRTDGRGSRTVIPLDFHPDNLSWRADGELLVAGQRASLTELLACAQIVRGACRVASVVALLNPATLKTTVVLEDDPPSRLGAASVAQQVGDSIWIGSFAADRIVELKANSTQP